MELSIMAPARTVEFVNVYGSLNLFCKDGDGNPVVNLENLSVEFLTSLQAAVTEALKVTRDASPGQ